MKFNIQSIDLKSKDRKMEIPLLESSTHPKQTFQHFPVCVCACELI